MFRVNYRTEKLEKDEDDFSMFKPLIEFIAIGVLICLTASLFLFVILP